MEWLYCAMLRRAPRKGEERKRGGSPLPQLFVPERAPTYSLNPTGVNFCRGVEVPEQNVPLNPTYKFLYLSTDAYII